MADYNIIYEISTLGEEVSLVTTTIDGYGNKTRTTGTINAIVDRTSRLIPSQVGHDELSQAMLIVTATTQVTFGQEVYLDGIYYKIMGINTYAAHKEIYLG